MRDDSGIVGVIQNIFSRPGKKLIVRHGRIAEIPRVAWRRAVRAHPRAEASELEPAHIHRRLRITKISTQVAAPERITAGA